MHKGVFTLYHSKNEVAISVSQLNSHPEELAWTCELIGVGLGHEIIVCNGVLCQQQHSLTASAYAFPAKHSVWGSLNATLAYP